MKEHRTPERSAGAVEPIRISHEAVAEVDSQLVNARWRWLHAVWEQDAGRVEETTAAIDALLELRFEIMQSAA